MEKQGTNVKKDMGTEKCDGKLMDRDVYETLWRCRDFEITALWQRSAMLGAFMVATYAGYGALMLKALEDGLSMGSPLFNVLALGMSCFGMLFSTLWILMLKGSKCWYEVCESALNAFNVFGIFLSEPTKSVFDRNHEVNDNLSSSHGGLYSVSRVAIVIGQVSLLGWGVLAMYHVGATVWQCCSGGNFLCRGIVVVITDILFFGLLRYVSVRLKKAVKSSSLSRFLAKGDSVER